MGPLVHLEGRTLDQRADLEQGPEPKVGVVVLAEAQAAGPMAVLLDRRRDAGGAAEDPEEADLTRRRSLPSATRTEME